MGSLLSGGGRVFWVAPSGGRDRPGPAEVGLGDFQVAPFDPKALDMFKLVAMQSQKVHTLSLPLYALFIAL